MSFQPSIEADRKAFGLKVTRQDFPVGVAGVRLSLTEIARRIREGGRTPSVRAFGEFILRDAGYTPDKTLTPREVGAAFLDYVHKNVRYVPDPVLTEFNQIAECTLCVPGAPMCMPLGDCDDGCVALGSLLASHGIPVEIVKQTFGAEDQEHVLIRFMDSNGEWVYADPSAKDKPVGWHAPASEEVYVDPNDPSAIGMVGAPDAEYVGVGSLALTRPLRRRALGATVTVDAYAQAANDLTSRINAVIASGDTSLSSGNYASAMSSYQTAGATGASVVGPEIDMAGASQVTQPITQQALSLNSTLQALDSGASASLTDSLTAQGLVKQMASLYAQAIDAGRATLASGGGMTELQKCFLAAGVGALVGTAWAYYQHSKSKPAASPVKHRAAKHRRRPTHRRRR